MVAESASRLARSFPMIITCVAKMERKRRR